MPTMLQVRNVPDEIHRTLKVRATLAGMPLSEYVLRELRRVAERPTPVDFDEGSPPGTPVSPSVPPAELLRREREAR